MNPDIKKKWVEALRSSEYQQGRGRLHNPKENTFCCLGVLCDIYRKENNLQWVICHGAAYLSGDHHEPMDGFLPPQVVDWAGVKDRSPVVEGSSLVALNDSDEFSFEKIAQYIEKYL